MSYQQEVFNLISSFTGHNANYVVPKEFMRMLKDSNSALILSQLVYWTGRQADPDGWIYKSYADWESEIFLSKKSVMIAVKRLKKIDVVETQVRKVRLDNGMLGDTCVHYQVNQKKLADLILNQLKSLGSAQRELPEMPKGNFQECPKGTSLSINTKITNKNYDNVLAPTPSGPELIQDKKKKSSSSFSESDLILIIAGLMALIPEKHQKPTVKATVTKALNAHSEDYVRLAILYTIAHSNGETWQKFKSFLGQCIDGGWADGWEPDIDQVDDEHRKAKFLESRRHMPDDILKADAEKGCRISAQVLVERGA